MQRHVSISYDISVRSGSYTAIDISFDDIVVDEGFIEIKFEIKTGRRG